MRGHLGRALAAIALLAATAHADTELKNDGFVDGGMIYAQGGFAAGEIAASRFVAPAAGRQLLHVQLLFAGATTSRDITLKVFDDSAGTDSPGAELFSGDFTLTGSNSALSDIDLTTNAVVVPAKFRVGIQFMDTASYPSVVRDGDGIMADKNFIFAIPPSQWFKSQQLGLQGDWVIRAFISDTGGGTPDAGVTPDAGGGGPDGGTTGSACDTNVQCPAGQFCDTANHVCTFECRMNSDCGDGTCNSLGQCVMGGGGGGGCCETDRGGGGYAGGALLGLGVLVLVVRRRR